MLLSPPVGRRHTHKTPARAERLVHAIEQVPCPMKQKPKHHLGDVLNG
ncbi:MAG: hypothetical protein ACUVXA_20285 [Candidatus Jordarchaeum sp.]